MKKMKSVSIALLSAFGFVAAATAATEAPEKSATTRPWAYQPVQRPAIPAVERAKWVRTPVDAFILAKLEEAKLTPSKDAGRATFIRRATLDTWGLLPTPDEVRAFEKDHSRDAYEKLVERLLASPRYGERWGRRWLDLSRYADSDGYNADGTRPNIWRYRDYVIKAFNDDKPYDRFVKEQLAGDELWPTEQEALIATGFLRNFPDEINARDLNLKKQEVANDLTDTVGTVLLGSTVGCAQCHNHKFDKISQKEYYQLQSFFVNASWNDDVPAATAEEIADYNKKKAKYEAATKDVQAKMDAILQPVIDKLEEDRLSGFVPETRVSIAKPEAEQTPYDRWIYHRNLWTMQGRTRNAVVRLKQKAPEKYLEYQELEADLKKFDKLKPKELGQLSTITELGHSDAPPTYVLFKGIYDRKLDEVQPGFPALFTDARPEIKPTASSSGRRTALANWIVSPENPLTARVFVNRLWGQYFGHAIVETVGDFGKMGTKPTHPELLDYLASSFVHDGNWSVKALQRQILLSSTYRQSSEYREDAARLDPQNKLLAVFPRQRLDAEQIRDSLLQAAGLLDETIGGPPVYPPQPPLPNQAGQNENSWKVSENPRDQNRRSVYIFVKRNNPYPLLDTFDWANPQTVHGKREVTTTAPQALALINSDLVYNWSQVLAGRVIREAGEKDQARVARLFEILYAREPSKDETRTLLAFLDSQEKVLSAQLAEGKAIVAPDGYGENPQVGQELDRLYKTLYGRSADRYEKAALVSFVEKQQQGGVSKLGTAAKEQPAPAIDSRAARAAAFVDLAHALANSNEFSYRF
ncbi:MAG TPA: DUF1549 and DUF1553 domain-containing protein [Steroidobacteraceae bacterium]|jgi:hypothetical protein|nr:DUF1549 and DUF1553 domain-containing protein [Steroidobacteraceae bacterium]